MKNTKLLLARSHARTLARSHTQVYMRRVDIDTTPEADDDSAVAASQETDSPIFQGQHAPWRLGSTPLVTCVT